MSTPPLPSLRTLTAELRALQTRIPADHGGRFVTLWVCEGVRVNGAGAYAGFWGDDPDGDVSYGREGIPGSTERECDECEGVGVFLRGLPCSFACPECNGSGRVSVPTPFDAVAAARRLLAAARDGGQEKQ